MRFRPEIFEITAIALLKLYFDGVATEAVDTDRCFPADTAEAEVVGLISRALGLLDEQVRP